WLLFAFFLILLVDFLLSLWFIDLKKGFHRGRVRPAYGIRWVVTRDETGHGSGRRFVERDYQHLCPARRILSRNRRQQRDQALALHARCFNEPDHYGLAKVLLQADRRTVGLEDSERRGRPYLVGGV